MNSDVGDTQAEQDEYARASETHNLPAYGQVTHVSSIEQNPLANFTDRQLLEEITFNLRAIMAVLDALGQNPMAKAMLRANGIKVD